jgi:hypothetical protein
MTAVAIVVFISSLLEIIPAKVGFLRMDLALLLILGLFTITSIFIQDKSGRSG